MAITSRGAALIIRNTFYNSGASLTRMAAGFIVSPIILASLGIERYGFWSLIWSITGSLGLLDLRLATAVMPLTAAAWAKDQHARVGALARVALLFYAFLGLLEFGAASLWVHFPGLIRWIPDAMRADGGPAVALAVAAFAINTTGSIFDSLLASVQRYDVSSRIVVGVTVLRAAALIIVARMGGGVLQLVMAELYIACVQCLAMAIAAGILMPDVRFLGPIEIKILRELFVFGGKLQVAHAAFLASFQADKWILWAFLGPAATGYYDLGSKVALLMRSFPSMLTSATMPEVSALEATGSREELWSFYNKGSAALIWAATPILVMMAAGGGTILFAWTGVHSAEAQQALALLAIGYYFNVISGMAYNVAIGMGKPEIEMNKSIWVGILNPVLSVCFVRAIGFAGAPLGTALSLTFGTYYMIRLVNLQFSQAFSAIWRLFRSPILAGVPALIGSYAIFSLIQGGRYVSLAAIAIAGCWIALVFTLEAIRSGSLSGSHVRSVVDSLISA